MLINEQTSVKHFEDSQDFIKYPSHMSDVYPNNKDCRVNKNNNRVAGLISDMLSKNILHKWLHNQLFQVQN